MSREYTNSELAKIFRTYCENLRNGMARNYLRFSDRIKFADFEVHPRIRKAVKCAVGNVYVKSKKLLAMIEEDPDPVSCLRFPMGAMVA